MRKKLFILLFIILFMFSGCDWADDFSDKYLYTTIYPIEYAAKQLYGEYAKISSVYPNGVDSSYVVTDKEKHLYTLVLQMKQHLLETY